MLRNYFKIAWRNLWRNKLYSFINIGGLATGIAACLLIFFFIRYEKGFDGFHDAGIYRLLEIQQKEGASAPQKIARTMFPMGPTLTAEFPEITGFARLTSPEQVPLQQPGKGAVMGAWCGADASFLRVLNFKLTKGNAATALERPGSIVLTEKLAGKLFGSEDPLGRTVRNQGRDTVDYIVTGVLQNIPEQSHLQFDALYSFSTALIAGESADWDLSWIYTYLQVKDGTDINGLEEKLPAYLRKYMGQEKAGEYQLFLQSIRDVHLWSGDITQDLLNIGKFNGSYLYLLAAVAVFVLVLAVINYINLSTARSITRAKEVGIRKTNGAHRMQIACQFLGETMIFTMIALVLAFLLIWLALPLVNKLSERNLAFDMLKEPFWLLAGSSIAIGAGLMAGLIPALFLTGIRPVSVLKGRLWTSARSPLRNALVIIQFTVAVGLSMATVAAFQQLKFMQQYDLGFNKEEVVVAEISYTARHRVETLIEQLRQLPGVRNVTGALRRLGNTIDQNEIVFQNEGSTHEMPAATMFVDYNYIPFYQIELLAGRNISPMFGDDQLGHSYLINESLARKLLQYTDNPQAPVSSLIGKGFRYSFQDTLGTIIGITRDFNFSSLHHAVEPLCLTYQYEYYLKELSIRIDGSHRAEVLSRIGQEWKSMLPNQQFDYYFLESHLEQLYKADTQMGRLMLVLTLLAIIISTSGLIGLAVYSIERRVKEIGIRKVLGASASSVAALLSRDFIKLVLIAIIIATPVAWYGMHQWLENFAYRVELQWWMFALAGLLALIVALLTVSFHSVKAALMNPVKSLRWE